MPVLLRWSWWLQVAVSATLSCSARLGPAVPFGQPWHKWRSPPWPDCCTFVPRWLAPSLPSRKQAARQQPSPR